MVALRALTLGMLLSVVLARGVQADPIGQTTPVDAFINLGTGSYPGSSFVTTGNAQPWYDSPAITSFFGGQPTAQQQQTFDNNIMLGVEQTFRLSEINLTLTDNPSVPAFHTLSLVSGAESAPFPGSIGTTTIGGNGFSFIDQEAKYPQTLADLEWIIAHNISHELMLAFGVPEQYDKTGNYIDATTMNWSTAINPNSTFSAGAAAAILANLPNQNNAWWAVGSGAQYVDAQTVPEPATIALWTMTAAGLVISRYRRPARNMPSR
jgi:hypothetical protein